MEARLGSEDPDDVPDGFIRMGTVRDHLDLMARVVSGLDKAAVEGNYEMAILACMAIQGGAMLLREALESEMAVRQADNN